MWHDTQSRKFQNMKLCLIKCYIELLQAMCTGIYELWVYFMLSHGFQSQDISLYLWKFFNIWRKSELQITLVPSILGRNTQPVLASTACVGHRKGNVFSSAWPPDTFREWIAPFADLQGFESMVAFGHTTYLTWTMVVGRWYFSCWGKSMVVPQQF